MINFNLNLKMSKIEKLKIQKFLIKIFNLNASSRDRRLTGVRRRHRPRNHEDVGHEGRHASYR